VKGVVMSNKKKTIELDLCIDDNDIKYKGRLLGIATDKEFAALLGNKELQSKVYTSGTVPLLDIADATNINGARLAMAVKEIDGVPVTSRRIFVSDKVDSIGFVQGSQMGIVTRSKYWLLVVETDGGI